MEVHALDSAPSLLIIDACRETREVLRTALAHRGTTTLEANRAQRGLELLRQRHFDVIVLDLELASEAPEVVRTAFSRLDAKSSTLVLLGTTKPAHDEFPRGQFVAKPYHYGPLIRKIERLLDEAWRPLTKTA